MDKNEWIIKILQDKVFCIKETKRLIEDQNDYIAIFSSPMSEKYFLDLISRIGEEHIAKFLSEYSIFVNAEEMTPKVFKTLLKCKRKYKKSILIGLCHSNISFYQLLILTRLKIDEESLLQLIDKCITNEIFSGYDLKFLLKLGKYYKNFSENLKYLIKEREKEISNFKLNILNEYL